MKKSIYIYLILNFIVVSSVFALDNEKLEHRIIAGFNIGATSPNYLPREIRKVEGWWPQFTPQLGYNIIYNFHPDWSVGTGILLDYKGMGVRDKVKYMHTRVKLEKGGEELEGYFTGTNETRVKSAYVTVPVFVRYKINEKWQVRAGGYAAYKFSASFKGEVYDGYLRLGSVTGDKVDITDGKATFDFGKDVQDFDLGVLAGAELKVNEKFNVFGNLDFGLRPIFAKDARPMDFNMYNIYFTLGLAYKL